MAGSERAQVAPTVEVVHRSGAGDEVVDEAQRVAELVGLLALAEQGEDDVVGPGARQHAIDQRRQRSATDATHDFLGGTTTRLLQLLATTGGFGDTLFGQFGALAADVEEILQLGGQLDEDRGVVVEVVQQAIDDRLHLVEQAAIAIGFGRPALGRVRKRVEQLARRMRLVREHAAVEQGDLQIRNLQACQQYLHLGRQVVVFEDELEEHADEVDRVLVHAGDVRGLLAAQLADLGEQLVLELRDVAADVRLRGQRRGGVRQHGDLALQQGQRAEQFRRAGQRARRQRYVRRGRAPDGMLSRRAENSACSDCMNSAAAASVTGGDRLLDRRGGIRHGTDGRGCIAAPGGDLVAQLGQHARAWRVRC